MNKTKQGIKNLNDIGPKRKRGDQSNLDRLCLVGSHPGPFEDKEVFDEDTNQNQMISICVHCGAYVE